MIVENLKKDIIKDISALENAEILLKLREVLNSVSQTEKIRHTILKQTRSKISIEILKKEQNYTYPNREILDYSIANMHIEEPLELLLEQLNDK